MDSWLRERPWSAFWCYVAMVFATVPFARDVVLTLRNTNLLGAAVIALYAVAVAFVVYHVFFDLRHADWVAFLTVAALISVLAALLLGLEVPEERVHFLQYGLMGLLGRRALAEPAGERDAALRAIALAFALGSVLGLLDEVLQGIVPSRVFDWRDVALNAAATAIALALDELLHDRLRLRAPRPLPEAGR
jgi:VanZ family protein